MNIIFPLAGLGERFTSEMYLLPKPMINILGQPMAIWSIESLNIQPEDKIYIGYNKILDKFNFTHRLKKYFPKYQFIFIPIEHHTRGAAETVLYILDYIDNNDKLNPSIIVDIDNIYNNNILNIIRKSKNNCIFYMKTENKDPIYSYITESGGKLTDIEEKTLISNNACVGAYGFSNTTILENTIKEILLSNKKQKNEFYISAIYKKLLENNIVIDTIQTSLVTGLGTPKDVKRFISNNSAENQKYKLYRFCFDLDNTLVSSPRIDGDYSTVDPIKDNINYLKYLYSIGHTIIIHTARRMRTHSGNVGRVQADVAKITFDTLDKFNIPYHEIYFGKPYADFYIDDLAINAYEDIEKITGIYNVHPEPRSHNTIEFKNNVVIKYSTNIYGEKYFYQNIPDNILYLFPKLIDYDQNSITIEKISGVPLCFLYANEILSKELFLQALGSVKTLHNSAQSNIENINIYANYKYKLLDRINSYNFTDYPDFNSIKSNILEYLDNYQNNNRAIAGVVHGDPVFSNIILDKHDQFKFIDMRGAVGDNLSVFGDTLYDYAKIYQSIIGYDFILMNKEINISYVNSFKNLFDEYIINNFNNQVLEDIKWITKSLIISLIPLHHNNKTYKYYSLINNI